MLVLRWRRASLVTSRSVRCSRPPVQYTRLWAESLERRDLLSSFAFSMPDLVTGVVGTSHRLLGPHHVALPAPDLVTGVVGTSSDLLFPLPTALPTPNAMPLGITTGPDGTVWFAEAGADQIGRLTPSAHNQITEFAVSPGSNPERITVGPDGALWFTEPGTNQIGRMTTDGQLKEYVIPTLNSNPQGITAGPDGAVWFTEQASDTIGRIDSSGTLTEFHTPWARPGPVGFTGITAGPDGALWFTEQLTHTIGRITTDGTFTEYMGTTGVPLAITAGPDGALWFTENGPTQIGRIGTDGTITEFGPYYANTFYGDITTGSDGAVWFVVNNTLGQVQFGRITPDGSETFINVPALFSLGGITSAPDGKIWFTETTANAIGVMLVHGAGAAPNSFDSNGPTSAPQAGTWMVAPGSAVGVDSLSLRSGDLLFSSLGQERGSEKLPSAPLSISDGTAFLPDLDGSIAGSSLTDDVLA